MFILNSFYGSKKSEVKVEKSIGIDDAKRLISALQYHIRTKALFGCLGNKFFLQGYKINKSNTNLLKISSKDSFKKNIIRRIKYESRRN